ncbi:serine/threonine protein kinase [Anoxybacillus sp. D401a]|uniref:serine/threonine protein kinase n=1 Tax=Anoxybacillus sp. D401a TaxID=575112 RepID=UPI003D3414A0
MVMTMYTSNSLCNIRTGTVIQGKWHKHRYEIIKQLGKGANGVVYLAKEGRTFVALKISSQATAMMSEVNVLKRFSEVQGVALGPCLLDVDDWIHPQEKKIHSFYVMEYIEGDDLLTFIQKRGKEWIIVIILQLLGDLHKLHEKGWVFGDLKPENLIVSGKVPKVRLIDVGGTTIRGRAIKEFTEFFDRGYWGMGTRKAEPSYDLFAVAMIMINMCYLKRFERKENGREQLRLMISSHPYLKTYEKILWRALDGKYTCAYEMRKELLQCMQQPSMQTEKKRGERVVHVKEKKKFRWVETMFLFVCVLFMYVVYLYVQIL